ncbi:HD domain-containing protein [uncultured Kriegella sp.]|uniref:HD domain-containing protein n=1 Tax=uncultured Kriegella sp. TaxID=1798910 RepID=UPI0030DC3AB1|tara:strand:- start:70668 stop:71255 length:588 start_codon:yes stop_codon:yes gene_type:complete
MIITRAKEYCIKILSSSNCKKLPFHNLSHTQEVVEHAALIAKETSIDSEETEPIIIAAWFHDTGHSKTYFGHEEVSKELANEYLTSVGYDTKKIKIVLSCIDATKMPQHPSNLHAKVLCDADLFHIGTELFFCKKLLLRREWELEKIKTYSDKEWHKINLAFLEKHKFKTDYGQTVLEDMKLKNLEKVKTILSFY